MLAPVRQRAASAYRKNSVAASVDAADPHRLISLLFDALLQSLAMARLALGRGDMQVKGEQIGRAVRFLEEGLKAGLNPAQGGELAGNLRGVYDYSIARLTLANLRNDDALIAEVIGLIEPVATAWKQIGTPAAQAQPAAPMLAGV